MSDATWCQSVLSDVSAFAGAKGLQFYLVGGFLRDQVMKRSRPATNIDFAIPEGALEISRRLAHELGGTYVCLDEAAGSARVVLMQRDQRVELDISDFRGSTIEQDLAKRDFTINAMAVPLEAWCAGPRGMRLLLDPLDGQRDLASGTLRACFEGTFRDDPVRILRAFRFAVELGMAFDPGLAPLMSGAVAGLSRVAGERIRDELFAILRTDRASWAIKQLDELGALDVVFPELTPGRGVEQGGYHHLDVLGHQLETVAQCDRILADLSEFSPELRPLMAPYYDTEPVEGRSRKALIKLAGLFHDVGKPATKRVEADGEIWFIGHEQFGANLVKTLTERLRLSRRESEMVHHLVLYHLRPGHLSREPQLTRRAIFRFFRDLEDDGPACLLVWWADRLATRGPSSHLDQIDQQRARLEELLRAYFLKAEEVIRPPQLLDGCQLMEALGLTPGPLIGKLLRAIQEAQAEGSLQTREEALALARQLLAGHAG